MDFLMRRRWRRRGGTCGTPTPSGLLTRIAEAALGAMAAFMVSGSVHVPLLVAAEVAVDAGGNYYASRL